MADVKPTERLDGAGWRIIMPTSGSDDFFLGGVHETLTGAWKIKCIPGGGSPSTFTPKTRPQGSGLSGANLDTPVYYDTEGNSITAGTASSADKTYIVPCGGEEVILTVAGAANGGTLYCKPVIGE